MDYEPEYDVVLKPCPFCGGEAGVSEGTLPDNQPWWYIECIKCSATGESVETWNARTQADALRAIEQVLSGQQPIDIPGALMVARSALESA